MRLGILGGSFDPVHIGHLILAEEACDLLGLDAFRFLPAFQPPHKRLSGGAGDPDRLEMLALACSGDGRFSVDDREIRRGGTSYTVETLGELSGELGAADRLFLLIGDDLAPGFSSWREPERIAGMSTLVLARRNLAAPPPFPWPHETLDNLLVPVSSSLIRERIGKGRSARQLLPPGVWDYIVQKGLYGHH